MACSKHPNYQGLRKPRIECKECWDLYNANQKAGIKGTRNTNKNIAENSNKSKKEEVIEIVSSSSSEVYGSVSQIIQLDLESLVDKDKLKEEIETYIQERLKKLRIEINHMLSINYEYKHINLSEFRVEMIDKEAKDGWRFKCVLTGDCAKLSNYKTDVACFERIKCENKK